MPVRSAYQDNNFFANPTETHKIGEKNMFFLSLISKTTWVKALGFGNYEYTSIYCNFTLIIDDI